MVADGKSEGTRGGGHLVCSSASKATLVNHPCYKGRVMQLIDTSVCGMVGGCVSKAKESRVWLAFHVRNRCHTVVMAMLMFAEKKFYGDLKS